MNIGDRFLPNTFFQSICLPMAVCGYIGISPGAKVAYAVLLHEVQEDGTVSIPIEKLSDFCGCTIRQSSYRLRELIRCSFITPVDSSGPPSRYRFVLQRCFSGDRGAPESRPYTRGTNA